MGVLDGGPLTEAVEMGLAAEVAVLLAAGMDPGAERNVMGQTPVSMLGMRVMDLANARIAGLLAEAGGLSDSKGAARALKRLVVSGQFEAAGVLLERGPGRTRGEDAAVVVAAAGSKDGEVALAWLANRGFDMAARDDGGVSGWEEAAMEGRPEGFAFFLKGGLVTDAGMGSLMAALLKSRRGGRSWEGKAECMSLLREGGFDLNPELPDGRRASECMGRMLGLADGDAYSMLPMAVEMVLSGSFDMDQAALEGLMGLAVRVPGIEPRLALLQEGMLSRQVAGGRVSGGQAAGL